MTTKSNKNLSGVDSGLVSEHEADGKASEHTIDKPTSPEKGSLTFLETLQSVAWAMLGVQSKKNAKNSLTFKSKWKKRV